MSTSHNGYGSIVFECDEIGCAEEFDTDYITWDYANNARRREGWYTFQDGHGGWNHFCPEHGKARWLAQKQAEEASEQSQLPPFMRSR